MNGDSSVCVVVMDFNIKFDTMKHSDNAVENFGNKCILWHRTFFCSIWVYVDSDVYEIRQENIYINHINAFDNTYDATCVLFLIESIWNFINRILSEIIGVILQSDNVRLYKNITVIFFIHILSISNGLITSCFVHTYTVADKVVINGNFITIVNILCAYVDVRFNVCTPIHLVCALNYNGGGYNCIE